MDLPDVLLFEGSHLLRFLLAFVVLQIASQVVFTVYNFEFIICLSAKWLASDG